MKNTSINIIPIGDTKVKVYDILPAPTSEVYDNAIPLSNSTDKVIARLVLYAPNLISVGSLDNLNADAETTFSKSLTNGFNFTTSQKLTVGAEFSVGVVFAKAGLKTSFELSFSEAWNNSETQTTTFKAPAGSLVYLYQGIMRHRIILYYPETLTYKWGNELGTLDTNIIKTSNVPIIGPVNSVVNI